MSWHAALLAWIYFNIRLARAVVCDKTAVLMQCCDGLAPLGELTGQPFPQVSTNANACVCPGRGTKE